MKSINQIFKDDKEILENESVQELIEYCRSLEDEISENKQDKNFSFEDKLSILVNELYRDIDSILEEEKTALEYPFRGLERPDFKDAMFNLNNYLKEFSRNYNYNFNRN